VPKYIADTNSLICPVTKRTGAQKRFGISDPKATTSYVFEFCVQRVPGVNADGGELTMREFKRLRMALLGWGTPILRCHLHPQVLNVGFDGQVYESPTDWEEERFKDVVLLDELKSPSTLVPRVVSQVRKESACARYVGTDALKSRLASATDLSDADRALRSGLPEAHSSDTLRGCQKPPAMFPQVFMH
jgi:hypothetical protein